MMRGALPLLLSLLLLGGVAPAASGQADARPPADVLARVVESIEALDRLRSGLAGNFLDEDVEVDQATFQNVCRPVGQRARQLSSENPWTVRQVAVKNRNPAHEAGPEAREIHRLMEERPELQAVWIHSRRDGREGYRYLRRITVERTCLACHGAAEDRPAFVREGYPEDRAYGFEVGDLRGLYSVFVPVDAEAQGGG